MTNEAAETEEATAATEEEVIVVDEQDHEKETDPEEEEDVFCPPAAAPPPPPPTRTTTSSSSRTGETTTTSKVKCRHCARPARKGKGVNSFPACLPNELYLRFSLSLSFSLGFLEAQCICYYVDAIYSYCYVGK